MVRRLVRDESGMTMGLAVIMIVLIGVMGAGLLTFVSSDLNSVIEENRGQRALDIADAGVQAAKAHLRVDSFREHYDTDGGNDCNEGIRVGGDNWSKATDIYTDPEGYCVGPGTRADDLNTPWREDQGVGKLFGGGRFHVTIECYEQQAGDVALGNPCDGGATMSDGTTPQPPPDTTTEASEEKFFKITSTGYDNPAGEGAIRRVEAIYTTAKKTYAPIAYWTPKNINFDGTRCASKMSFFAGLNITGVTHGSACGPANPYGTGKYIAHRPPTTTPPLPPEDAIYGDWYAPSYNITRRVDAGGTPITKVGFGAMGLICPTNTCSADSHSVADGYNDYDRTTGSKGQGKAFVPPATPPPAGITFPFDAGNALSNPSSLVDAGLMEEMSSAAADQGNYITSTNAICDATKCTINNWPAPGAIYFVDAGGKNVILSDSTAPQPEGMLIVRNGNLTFNSSSEDFKGVLIVIGNGTATGVYTQPGSIQLDGYVAASGNININGNVSPSTTIDYTNLNSFYDVKLWSWRELYE